MYELVEIYVEHLIDVPIIDEGLAKGRGKDFVLREDFEVVQINDAENDCEGEGQGHDEVDGEGQGKDEVQGDGEVQGNGEVQGECEV